MMRVTVLAKANSKKESIEVNLDGSLSIKVRAVPEDGKANKRIVELLSDYYNVPKSAIVLISGSVGKKKIFQIGE